MSESYQSFAESLYSDQSFAEAVFNDYKGDTFNFDIDTCNWLYYNWVDEVCTTKEENFQHNLDEWMETDNSCPFEQDQKEIRQSMYDKKIIPVFGNKTRGGNVIHFKSTDGRYAYTAKIEQAGGNVSKPDKKSQHKSYLLRGVCGWVYMSEKKQAKGVDEDEDEDVDKTNNVYRSFSRGSCYKLANYSKGNKGKGHFNSRDAYSRQKKHRYQYQDDL